MHVIDSHTVGEPTRIIIAGGPDLGCGPLAERARVFRQHHDAIRRAVCEEPRGHDAMVGGLLCEAHEPDCDCGIIFFNNHSTLGMCIHGTIGLIATIRHLGRLHSDLCRIDTPVGVVTARIEPGGRVCVTNVPSYRLHADLCVEVPGWGPIHGDVAWGGNWFFLIQNQGPELGYDRIPELTRFGLAVRNALLQAGIHAPDGAEIDHIEIFGPPADPDLADSRNFVLCPGGAYDRSPCGTGVSAKLACLAAAGQLAPGEIWRQASILNHHFEGTYEALPDGRISPSIRGQAWVTAESHYHFDPSDPFRYGFSRESEGKKRVKD